MTEAAVTIEMQAGEGKWFKFTITRDGAALDVSTADDLNFAVRKVGETDFAHQVEKADFDVTQASEGIIRANLPKSVSKDMDGTYDCGLEVALTDNTDVEQRVFKLKVKKTLMSSL